MNQEMDFDINKLKHRNLPSFPASKPSGFIVGIMCILVSLTRLVTRSLTPYPSSRYCINKRSVSRPTTSFPCMLPIYLNSGSPA